MPTSTLQHRRTHNLLLISKLLNQRDAASPFTLIIDHLEQSGSPLQREIIARAAAAKVKVIFVAFETLKKPKDADAFIRPLSQNAVAWEKHVLDFVKENPTQRKVIIIDSLNTLAATSSANLPSLLSNFISPTTSLVAGYHLDIYLNSTLLLTQTNPYAPDPFTQLKYIATTIFTVHSLHHILAQQSAHERSHVEPTFGLGEFVEGIVQGLGCNSPEGFVLEMLHRRKSGRDIKEWYFFPLSSKAKSELAPLSSHSRDFVILLEDHPLYVSAEEEDDATDGGAESTFELGLTEKQRSDREGVVLPYTDAQQGRSDGGRILYLMGEEDDFDEEEDEI